MKPSRSRFTIHKYKPAGDPDHPLVSPGSANRSARPTSTATCSRTPVVASPASTTATAGSR
jgi:hypothetical protein